MPSKFLKALVFNDLHIPWQAHKAVELTLQVGEAAKPDLIVIDGDLMDMWEISSFVKHPLRSAEGNLRVEVEQGRNFLYEVRRRFPDTDIKFVFGNHEYRWVKYLATHARELAGLEGLTLEEQLHCKQLKIEVINSGNRESSWMWGKLLVGHFDLARKHSGYTARGLIEDKGVSLIQAHCHRGGSSFKRNWDRDIVGYENFCLCDRDPAYVDRPNWQHGFSLVYKKSDTDQFYVEQHPIVEMERGSKKVYWTFYNGEIYQV